MERKRERERERERDRNRGTVQTLVGLFTVVRHVVGDDAGFYLFLRDQVVQTFAS
jgi:hypothetical protein